MDEIVGFLEKTISPRQEDQKEAVAYFDAFIKRDLGGFLQKLSDVLYNQSLPPYVRAAAGLQLKNQLTAKDEVLKQTQQDKWISLPTEMKDYVKQRVFAALSTELYKPLTVPQCVANIAIIELPLKQWPGLVEALVQNITNPANADHVKQSTLETIGYICQDIDQSSLEPNDSSIILSAIVNGMQNSNRDVKLAATTALSNYFEVPIKNIAKTSQSISFLQLGQTLRIDPQFVEQILAQMVRDDKIQGHLNQIDGVIHFETKKSMQIFDEDIMAACFNINEIVEKIKSAVPVEWWMANNYL